MPELAPEGTPVSPEEIAALGLPTSAPAEGITVDPFQEFDEGTLLSEIQKGSLSHADLKQYALEKLPPTEQADDQQLATRLKLARVSEAYKDTGITSDDLWKMAKNTPAALWSMGKGIVKTGLKVAGIGPKLVVGGVVEPALRPIVEALPLPKAVKEFGKSETPVIEDVVRTGGELLGGLESEGTGLLHMGERAGEKAGRAVLKVLGLDTPFERLTNGQILANFDEDISNEAEMKAVSEGKGNLTQTFYGPETAAGSLLANKGMALRPEEIQSVSEAGLLGLPAFAAGGTALKAGAGAVAKAALPASVLEAGAKVGAAAGKVTAAAEKKVGDILSKGAGYVAKGTVLGSAAALDTANFLGKMAPLIGLGVGAAKGGPVGALAGGIAGETIARRIGRVIAPVRKVVKRLDQSGKNLVAGTPEAAGPYGRLVYDVAHATPEFVRNVGAGALDDVFFALATSETPEEVQNQPMFGTFLRMGPAAGRVAQRFITGQEIAPRNLEVKPQDWWPEAEKWNKAEYGIFPNLDAMHKDNIGKADEGVQRRIGAMRAVAAQVGGQVFLADSARAKQFLIDLGYTPEYADNAVQQRGITQYNVPDSAGNPQKISLAINPDSAPHEVKHIFQAAAGWKATALETQTIKHELGRYWEAAGQDYTRRVLPEPALKEAAALGLPWQEALVRFTDRVPDTETVTPEYVRERSDEILGQELGADIYNALVAHGGPELVAGQGLPGKFARILAGTLQALGQEPWDGSVVMSEAFDPNSPLQIPVTRRSAEAVRKGTLETPKSPLIEPGSVPPATTAAAPPVAPPSPAAPTPALPTPPTTVEEAQARKDKALTDLMAPFPKDMPDSQKQAEADRRKQVFEDAQRELARLKQAKVEPVSTPTPAAPAPTPTAPAPAPSPTPPAIEPAAKPGVAAPKSESAVEQTIRGTAETKTFQIEHAQVERDSEASREQERAAQELARELPDDVRRKVEKIFTVRLGDDGQPRIEDTGKGRMVVGIAPIQRLVNAKRVAKMAIDAKRPDLVPYPTNGVDSLTAEGWKQLHADMEKVQWNHENGWRGDGSRPITVPEGTDAFVPPDRFSGEPETGRKPIRVDQAKADFINLLNGASVAPPKSLRAAPEGTQHANVRAQRIAKASSGVEVEPRVQPLPTESGGFFGGELGENIKGEAVPRAETNPLRKKMAEAGLPIYQVPDVESRIHLKHITDIQARPDIRSDAVSSDVSRAGFSARREQSRKLWKEVKKDKEVWDDDIAPWIDLSSDGHSIRLELLTAGLADSNAGKAEYRRATGGAAPERRDPAHLAWIREMVARKLYGDGRVEAQLERTPAFFAEEPSEESLKSLSELPVENFAYPPAPKTSYATPDLPPTSAKEFSQSAWLMPDGKAFRVENSAAGGYHDDAVRGFSDFDQTPIRGKSGEEVVSAFQRETGAVRVAVLSSERALSEGNGQIGISTSYRPTEAQLVFLQKRLLTTADGGKAVYENIAVDILDPSGNTIAGKVFSEPNIKSNTGAALRFLRDPRGGDVTRAGFSARREEDTRRTGLAFKKFFSDVTKGDFGKSSVPFEPVLDMSGPREERFIEEQLQHTGNFDEHISKSIPTFKETQIKVGNAILSAYPTGGRVLDIGASEGSLMKTISALSGGAIETVSLDPNPDMARFFREKSQVPGATYSEDAFLKGFEDAGKEVPAFDTDRTFDVVHESMAFQFISPERGAQIAEAKRLLKPDGILLTEQKVMNPDWKANEALKDTRHKAKYFSESELAAKDKKVGFQQSKSEEKAVGMVDNMVSKADLEKTLRDQFGFVAQYWDSGNFKGYAASDSPRALEKFLSGLGNVNSEFSTVETPRKMLGNPRFSARREEMTAKEQADLDKAIQYYRIGHGPSTDRETGRYAKDRMWHYDPRQNKLDTFHTDSSHEGRWGDVSRSYKGRYDDAQKKISVRFPDAVAERIEAEGRQPTEDDIPTGVYNSLRRQFGDEAQMVVFSAKRDVRNFDQDIQEARRADPRLGVILPRLYDRYLEKKGQAEAEPDGPFAEALRNQAYQTYEEFYTLLRLPNSERYPGLLNRYLEEFAGPELQRATEAFELRQVSEDSDPLAGRSEDFAPTTPKMVKLAKLSEALKTLPGAENVLNWLRKKEADQAKQSSPLSLESREEQAAQLVEKAEQYARSRRNSPEALETLRGAKNTLSLVQARIVESRLLAANEKFADPKNWKNETNPDWRKRRREAKADLLGAQADVLLAEQTVENTTGLPIRELQKRHQRYRELLTDWKNSAGDLPGPWGEALRNAKTRLFQAGEERAEKLPEPMITTPPSDVHRWIAPSEGLLPFPDTRFSAAREAGAPKGEEAKAAKLWEEKAVSSPYFKKWFGRSKVRDSEGEPLVVYHGRLNEFDAFDKSKAGVESDVGPGFYFTSDRGDSEANYASLDGPDQVAKLEGRIERLLGEEPYASQYADDPAGAYRKAKAAVLAEMGDQPNVLPTYLKMERPVVVSDDPRRSTRWDLSDDTEGYELMEAVRTAAYNLGGDGNRVWVEVSGPRPYGDVARKNGNRGRHDTTDQFENGGIVTAQQLLNHLRSSDSSYDVEGGGSAIFNEAMRHLGFDGVKIENPNVRYSGMGLPEGTEHYVVFEPEQVKSVDNRGTFDPNDPRFRFSAKRKPGESESEFQTRKDDEEYEKARRYFDIGHKQLEEIDDADRGPLSPEEARKLGQERIWFYDTAERRLLTAPSSETHGTAWTHERADQGFKGRYDALDNTLSVVFPERLRNRLGDREPTEDDIPTGVHNALRRKFGNEAKMVVFSAKRNEVKTAIEWPEERTDAERDAELEAWEAARQARKQQRESQPTSEYTFLKAGPDGFSKAWILPSGKMQQLGPQWHHQWLVGKEDELGLSKKDVRPGDEGYREAFLRKGAVRVNYANNTGSLTIEARQKDWRGQRDTVRKLVEANLDKLDNVAVHLLNDAGTKAVDSDSVRLFKLRTPEEKLAAIPFLEGSSEKVDTEAMEGKEPTPYQQAQAFPDATVFSAKREDLDELAIYDNHDRVQQHQADILEEFLNSRKTNPNKRISWPKIPAARLKKIWLDYGRSGVVRDERGMEAIKESVLSGIARLRAATELVGHTERSPQEISEELGIPLSKKQWEDFYNSDFIVNEFSDYGLAPLERIYDKLFKADTAEEQLHLVDRALNIVHQRGDLAALFVEGGTKTLNEVASQGGYQSPDAYSARRFTHADLPEELDKARKGESTGQTFNADGSVWNPRNKRVDLVTLASVNVPQSQLTKDAVLKALADKAPLLDLKGVVAGIFKLEDRRLRNAKGVYEPAWSIDLNAVVPQEFRQNSWQFAHDNGQQSIWDARKGEAISTGSTGDTVLTHPKDLFKALSMLQRGESVDVGDLPILRQREEAVAGEQGGFDFLKSLAVRDPRHPSNMTRAEVAKEYPEVYLPKNRDELVDISGLDESPLFKSTENEDAAVKQIGEKLAAEYRAKKHIPEVQDGEKWYSRFVPLLKKHFGADSQIMAELLAATSPRNNPTVNFQYATEALWKFKDGHYDGLIEKFVEGLNGLSTGETRKQYEADLKEGQVANPKPNPSDAAVMAHWIDKYGLKPTKANDKLFGATSDAVMQVLARVWMNEGRGPKVGNFVRNLLGIGHRATIDVWAGRLLRRLSHEGYVDKWRVLPANDAGISDRNFDLGQRAFDYAANKLGIEADALQGALWFSEKKHWADKGWQRLNLGDYATEMKKLPELRRKYEGKGDPDRPTLFSAQREKGIDKPTPKTDNSGVIELEVYRAVGSLPEETLAKLKALRESELASEKPFDARRPALDAALRKAGFDGALEFARSAVDRILWTEKTVSRILESQGEKKVAIEPRYQ